MEQVTLDSAQQQAAEKSFEMANDSSWKQKLPDFRNAIAKISAADPYVVFAQVQHKALFKAFLSRLAPPLNQQYNCRCCEEFFDDFAGVVMLQNDGSVKSPFFTPELAPEGMEEAYAYLADVISKGTVVDFFKESLRKKGTKGDPRWSHWGINFNVMIIDAIQKTSGRNLVEEMNVITEGFPDNTALLCARAVRILQKGAKESPTVRSHVHMLNVYSQAYGVVRIPDATVVNRRNALARLTIENKTLYHFRGSAAGKLLDALAECEQGSIAEKHALAEYFKQTDGTLYKRAVADASQAEVERAEKWFVENNWGNSLPLRQAVEEDLADLPVQWEASAAPAKNEGPVNKSGSLFGVLKKDPGDDEKQAIAALPKLEKQLGEITITRFLKDILPQAVSISVFTDSLSDANVCAGVTQVNRDSKPLHKTNAMAREAGYRMVPLVFSVTQNGGPRAIRALWGIKSNWLPVRKMIALPSEEVVDVSKEMADRFLLLVDGIEGDVFTEGLKPTYFPASLVQELQAHRAVMENLIHKVGYAPSEEGKQLRGVMVGPRGSVHLIVETATEKLIFRFGDKY